MDAPELAARGLSEQPPQLTENLPGSSELVPVALEAAIADATNEEVAPAEEAQHVKQTGTAVLSCSNTSSAAEPLCNETQGAPAAIGGADTAAAGAVVKSASDNAAVVGVEEATEELSGPAPDPASTAAADAATEGADSSKSKKTPKKSVGSWRRTPPEGALRRPARANHRHRRFFCKSSSSVSSSGLGRNRSAPPPQYLTHCLLSPVPFFLLSVRRARAAGRPPPPRVDPRGGPTAQRRG